MYPDSPCIQISIEGERTLGGPAILSFVERLSLEVKNVRTVRCALFMY